MRYDGKYNMTSSPVTEGSNTLGFKTCFPDILVLRWLLHAYHLVYRALTSQGNFSCFPSAAASAGPT